MRTALIKIGLSTLCAFSALALIGVSKVEAEPQFKKQSEVGTGVSLPLYEWDDAEISVKKGIVVAVPGLVFSGSAYDSAAKYLAQQGFRVFALELRGYGRWQKESAIYNGDTAKHYGQSQVDLLKILEAIRQIEPGLPVYLLGESFGSNISMWVMSNRADLVDGAILVSPAFKQCIHIRMEWPADFLKFLVMPHRDYSINHYVEPYISEDKKLRKECTTDDSVIKYMSCADLIKAAVTSRNAWKRIECIPPSMPILIVAGKKDAMTNSRVIPTVVAQRLGSKQISIKIIEDRGHLLVEHQPIDAKVIPEIADWLDERARQHRGAPLLDACNTF